MGEHVQEIFPSSFRAQNSAETELGKVVNDQLLALDHGCVYLLYLTLDTTDHYKSSRQTTFCFGVKGMVQILSD